MSQMLEMFYQVCTVPM